MDTWIVEETEFNPDLLHARETLFTIGNGYLGTRGAFEEGYPGAWPATLVNGLFDDAPIVNTELVNVPNWLNLVLMVEGERFRLDRGTVLAYRRVLDLRTGTLTRMVHWRSPGGRTVELVMERFASLADPHVLGIRYQVTAVDFAGTVELRAGIDGHVDNTGLLHLDLVESGPAGPQAIYLHARTLTTRLEVSEAAALVVSGAPATYTIRDCDVVPGVAAQVTVQPGQTVVAEKLVTIYSGRECPDVRAAAVARLRAAQAAGYAALRAAHDAAWAAEWADANVTIEGDDEADRALRYNLFQLLIAAPRHDTRLGIPAKTLSGFGYRGHAFWDTEIFVLPFFIYTRPALARNLLLYRYHTLPGARRKAQAAGYEGALYAWESAATGDETTPRWVPGPHGEDLVRIWCGDIEQHISADVAYGVLHYWRVTGDDAFMRDYGAEIVLDTARFWGSRAEWNATRQRYEINDVIGPDEYHEHVNNNVFTNRMARWNLEMALEVLAWLRRDYPARAAELVAQLELTPERLEHWKQVIEQLFIPQDPETGLLEQFDGFFQLTDALMADYEPRQKSMQVVLGIEGANRHQVLKQPDAVMLLTLLPEAYSQETLQVNWDYYTPRTDLTFGSSLGPAMQALATVRLGKVEEGYAHFMHAAVTDLQDVRGNSADGIHAATAGGLWQAAILGFGGLLMGAQGYTVTPRLPAKWQRLTFSFYDHGQKVTLAIAHQGPAPVVTVVGQEEGGDGV